MTKDEIGYLLENGFTVADIMAMTSTGAQDQKQDQEQMQDQEQTQEQEQEQDHEQEKKQKQEQKQEQKQDQHSKEPGWAEVMNAIAGLTKAVQNGNIFHTEQTAPQEQSIEDTMRILVFGKNREG